MSGLVYLACPYSHPDPAVRLARFLAANRAMLEGWRESVGVTAEIGIAADLGLPVEYLTP